MLTAPPQHPWWRASEATASATPERNAAATMGVRNKEVDYKDPAFDPNSATVLELRSILGQYGVPMRGRLNKVRLTAPRWQG